MSLLPPQRRFIKGLIPVFDAIEALFNGYRTAFAVVVAAGTVLDSNGISSVSKTGTGIYEVVFSHNYSGVPAVEATARAAGYIAAVDSQDADGCEIHTTLHDGTLTDQGFNLTVVGRAS